jgi:uncharacterized protein
VAHGRLAWLRKPARGGYGRHVPGTRFITDSSLESLARRLRFLGHDVVTLPGARLEDVMAAARRDGRTVLTLSARRPRRWADVPALTVARDDEAGTVRALAARYPPEDPPFSRCSGCNTRLERRLAIEARGEVPGRVLRAARELRYCPGCGRWYWDGTHVRAIRDWLERAVGRPLEPPDDDGRAQPLC